MLPPISYGLSWGLGPANLDVVFSGLELEVRSSIDEIKNLDDGIDALEKELEAALEERENALRALAAVNLESNEVALSHRPYQHLEQNVPPDAVVAETAVIIAPIVQPEQPSPTEQQVPTEQPSPGGLIQAPHGQSADDQEQQLREAADRPSEEPTARPDDEPTSRDVSPSAPILQPPVQQRDEAVMEEASPPLSAEDIKKRLLQVLRHLRDTAAICRQIPDLDRNFSNMLKSTYKTLYDSLKEVTPSKGAGRPSPAAGAAATAAATAASTGRLPRSESAGRNPSQAAGAKKGAASEAQAASDPPGIGTEPAAAVAARTRDLSALARLVHAKRLHQQADGGAAARDADQPPARRPARAPTPANSAGARLPTLYDGLPPARVTPAPGHATPETAAEAAEPQSLPQVLETAAATGQVPSRGVPGGAPLRGATPDDTSRRDTEAGGAPVPASSSSPAEGTPARGTAAREGAGDGEGCGGGGGQAAASPPCCGGSGSPSQQLLEQARASGGGMARSLLLRTAQSPAGCETRAPPDAPQPDGGSQGDGCARGGAAAAATQAAAPAPGARVGGGAQQRAKRALELEPMAAGSDPPLEPLAPVSASKRPHTGS